MGAVGASAFMDAITRDATRAQPSILDNPVGRPLGGKSGQAVHDLTAWDRDPN